MTNDFIRRRILDQPLIACPYVWCHATVRLIDGGETDRIIELHDIKNEALTGKCPASLMRERELATFNSESNRILRERANVDESKVNLWNTRFDGNPEIVPQNYASSPNGVMHLYCLTRHLPGEPCPGHQNKSTAAGRPAENRDSPGWALGGREDEDVIPHDQVVVPIVPQGVTGVSYGGGTGMASITELAAMANGAAVSGNEAFIAMKNAQDKLEDALRIYHAIQAEGSSGRIGECIAHTNNAINKCITGRAQIEMAADSGQAFVQNLFA